MEYQILLLDDDVEQLNMIEFLINKYKVVSGISINTIACICIEQARQILKKTDNIDSFFLDIALSDDAFNDDGIRFAKYLRKMPQYHDTPIIFITSYGYRISEALNNVHCYSFIIKPFTVNDFHQQLNDLFFNKNYYISVKGTDGIYKRIFTNQLIYIYSCGRYMQYVTPEGVFRSRQFRLKDIIDKLPKNFFRCHNQYIVNASYVDTYDFTSHFLHLSVNGEIVTIPLSRHFNQKNLFKDTLSGINKEKDI